MAVTGTPPFPSQPSAERRLPGQPLGPCLGRLRRGAGDPTHRHHGGRWFRATCTPEGPALLEVAEGRETVARAWGAGAVWVLDQLPALLGHHDDPSGFRPDHPVLREAQRRFPGLRVGRTDAVWEALAPAVIEQKVTGKEAFAGFRWLVRRHGTPAPVPPEHPAHDLVCPPDPDVWARIPSWEWLRAGIDGARSRTVVTAARRAGALERTLHVAAEEADRRLQSLPGIGPWTSAEVRQRAHGDPDAWSDGDYHVPGWITFALVGEKLDNDAAREVLEPYRGHRYRVQQLIGLIGAGPERRGPRRSLPTHLPRSW
ncbi:MAG: DNA-3-methyladenine glycosylase 2 family protein [Propionibacteriaceae bacterium]|nr:DNA-3-methyladenine glycosylase 2 family protein [Propionibacteriaceae bacterium]